MSIQSAKESVNSADAVRRAYFVSLVVTNAHDVDAPESIIQKIADTIAESFDFWEVIVAVDATREEHVRLAEKLRSVPNIRFIVVRERVGPYRIRTIAASEAIGDLIVVTPITEASSLDLRALADASHSSNEITIYATDEAMILSKIPALVLSMLTGFRIVTKDLHTTALPRTALNDILIRDTADLDLRFDRRSSNAQRARLFVKGTSIESRTHALSYRFSILSDLIKVAAPRVLSILSAVAAATFLGAIAYAAYAIIIYLTKANVAPGWFTTSILLAGLTGFMALSVFAMSLGILGLYDRVRQGAKTTITEEINNTDFFADSEATL